MFIKSIEDRFALPFTFLLAKIQRKPFILWTQQWMHPDTPFHKISFVMMKYIYRHADAIVVYGDHVRQYLLGLDVSPDKIFCALQSLDNGLFNMAVTDREKQNLRSELKLSDERVLIYVGRLEECKGLTYLLEAVAQLKDTNARVLFIGTGSQKDSLQVQCEQFNIQYQFLDYIANDQLYRYYAIADIFILPSITTKVFKEPWGAVINEAMNQGCPVIATDAVGAAMGGLVVDGKTGYIVPEKDSRMLSRSIEKILGDEGLRLQMGRQARERVSQWTPQRTVDGFVEAIDFVLGESIAVKSSPEMLETSKES